MNKIMKYSLILILVILTIIIIDYNCPIYNIIGIPCPGCGITRAFKALLQLDFNEVLIHNASIYLYVIASVAFILKFKYCKKIIIMCISLIIVYYLFRMFLYFPHTYPMQIRDSSIIAYLITFFNLYK